MPYRLMRPTENNRKKTAETVSPVQRLAQLTAELDALHNDRLLVSPHVDKKQIAAVICRMDRRAAQPPVAE